MRRSAVARLFASAAAIATAAIFGCSLIVPGDVPEFRCTGTDPSSCPPGTTCDTTTSKCVSDAGAPVEDAGELDAGEDAQPDAQEGGEAGPLDLGGACRVNEDCKSRICGTSTILTTAITGGPGPICTTPCCTSAECAPSFVCFNGGTGGGYCVPAALAARTPPSSGGKTPGSTCVNDNECRSGLCTGTPKRCLDTCCVQNECAAGTICRLKSVAAPAPSHDIWICATPEVGATSVPGDACTDSTNCTTDNCIGLGGGRICRPPCSNTASCRTVAGFENGHCLYGSSGSDYFKFCFSGTTASDSDAGAACVDDSTCQSDYCDPELKKCANVCGRDSDCAPTEACRPSAVNTPYLRCVAK
ncbi:MAG: hypothetical protein KF819_01315 [Labilithrix sp.]|nr:hypothetical protein [Labilithrix sp.]